MKMAWPDGKRFAFTVFDDPDKQTEAESKLVYGLLGDLGIHTTKGVWPLAESRKRNSDGETCDKASFRKHCQELQQAGFELGFHNATLHSSGRAETIEALDRFREYFGADPVTMTNHYNREAIYWGPSRISGWRRSVYNMATALKKKHSFFGHVEGDSAFWGDVCRERLRYCRNFVFAEINTLKVTPLMPYHDPERPYVREWFSSTDGANCPATLLALSEGNQDKLESEGGACILYTHFGHGFVENGRINPKFVELISRLSKKGGWFVPVATLLDYLKAQRGGGAMVIDDRQRRAMETRWLFEKLTRGAS